MEHDLVVLFEHPEWQKPLWAALEKRGVRYAAFDLKQAAFDPDALPHSALYFNQASPSAYVRGNTRAVPLALSLMRSLELAGARVSRSTPAHQPVLVNALAITREARRECSPAHTRSDLPD